MNRVIFAIAIFLILTSCNQRTIKLEDGELITVELSSSDYKFHNVGDTVVLRTTITIDEDAPGELIPSGISDDPIALATTVIRYPKEESLTKVGTTREVMFWYGDSLPNNMVNRTRYLNSHSMEKCRTSNTTFSKGVIIH